MEILEAVTGTKIGEDIKVRCPYETEPESMEYDPESIANDDADNEGLELTTVIRVNDLDFYTFFTQANDGGALGRNIKSGGLPGKEKTFLTKIVRTLPDGTKREIENLHGIYFGKTHQYSRQPMDSATTSAQVLVTLPEGTPNIDDMGPGYPFTVAAHHLIPGNGSLKASRLWNYLNKTGEPRVRKKRRKDKTEEVDETPTAVEVRDSDANLLGTWKIVQNIGYNVNGAHNGVWLPGSYAMHEPKKEVHHKYDRYWLDRGGRWRDAYRRAVENLAGGQFHDTHSKYNNNVVINFLNPIADALDLHIDKCPLCSKQRNSDVGLPPPYPLIRTLFRGARWLRTQVCGDPTKASYFTSDTPVEEAEDGNNGVFFEPMP